MHIVSLALGGCLRGEPVAYGITEDTGGHITYILGEMRALVRRPEVERAEIVTRLFDEPRLGAIHGQRSERLGPKLFITRIDSGNAAYLAKEALARDRDAFTRALLAELGARERLPDLIHAHFADAAEIARRVREALGIPFIYTAHSLGIDKRAAAGGDRSESAALEARIAEEARAIRSADAIIASSRDECERQLPAYPGAQAERIHRLRPGVDTRRPSAGEIAAAQRLLAPFLRKPSKPIVLALARPVAKKNLAGLIDAFARTPGLREAANLVILAGLRDGLARGEAEQRAVLADLVDRIDRHELYGHVAYPPRHTRADVRALYALARRSGGLFVNPALTEPYGLTLIEAAVHGLPVVATRHGGPADILEELGHGELVDPRDQPAIGRAMLRLLTDRAAWARASANARANVRAMTWQAYAAAFVGLARELVRPRQPATMATPPSTLALPLIPALAPTLPLPASESLVLCDIDNTLTGCRRGARSFARFVRRHPRMAFGVATGRSLAEARRVLREWELPAPLVWITSVGSELYWQEGDGLVSDREYAALIAPGWDAAAVEAAADGLAGLRMQAPIEQRRFKRSWFAESPAVIPLLQERLCERAIAARIVFSHERLLDILPARAGKAGAMAHAARVMGLAESRVFAAGDSGNDEDMLASCRNSILVGNHSHELDGLRGAPNVYVAARHHARGALEGFARHGLLRRGEAPGTLAAALPAGLRA